MQKLVEESAPEGSHDQNAPSFFVMVTNVTPPAATADVNKSNHDVIMTMVTSALENVTSNVTVTSGAARDERLAQIEIGVQAFIFLLALIGNSCVLLALRYRKKKTSRMHLFIMHLSIADLLVAFCNVLPQLAWDITYRFKGPDVLCRVVTYLQLMVMYLSTYVLVMTAIDRYRAICHPLSNYSWSTKRVHAMIGTAWLFSLLLSVPQLFIWRRMEVKPGVYDCRADFGEGLDKEWKIKVYVTCFFLSIYILPFFMLVMLYGRISYELWWNLRCKRSHHSNSCHTLNGKIVYKFNGTGTISIISPNTTNEHDLSAGSSAGHYNINGVICGTTGGATTSDWENVQLQRDYNKNNANKRLTVGNNEQNVTRCQCQCHSDDASRRSRPMGHRRAMTLPRPHGNYRGLSRSKIKTIKLTFVVIVAYLFCWSPFFITQMWWAYDENAPYSNSTFVICLLLASLNSCCNPWIYMAFSTNFLQSVIPCCRSRPNPPNYQHHRVCSIDEGKKPVASSSNSESLTPDDNNRRMEKNLLDSRGTKHMHGAVYNTGKSTRGSGVCGTNMPKCVSCGISVQRECKGNNQSASAEAPPVTINSWRWRCNLFPSSCKTRGGINGYGVTPRGQIDIEQCQPLHKIQEEPGIPCDPARSAENRRIYDGLPRYRKPSLERYLKGKKSRKSLSQPSLFCRRHSSSDEQLEVRCTSV